LDSKHAKSAAINGKKFNIVPADFSSIASREQLSAGVFLGVLDNEAGTSEDVSLPPGRFNLYLNQAGGQWQAYAEQGGKIYKAKRAIERPDTPANMDPTFNRGSGCRFVSGRLRNASTATSRPIAATPMSKDLLLTCDIPAPGRARRQ